MVTTRQFVVALLVLAASCARSASSTPGGAIAGASQKRNPDVITQDELLDPAIMSLDLGTALRRLRPNFFRATTPQSFSNAEAGSLHYSHDYGPLLPVSQLSSMNTMSVVEVRYLNQNEAQNRFGVNANGGPVIVVLSNRQVP